MMTPYYKDSLITLYHGDSRKLLDHINPKQIDLVVTDPPYGIDAKVKNHTANRDGYCPAQDFPAFYGDRIPFDPRLLLRFPRLIIFGANYFANRLPHSPSWIIWDKLNGLKSKRELGYNDSADVELIWTNLGGPARLLRHRWIGLMKDSEKRQKRVHPTQKPVALIIRLLEWYAHGMVLDPYAGSGTTLLAARQLGLPSIGIEYEEHYCKIAVERIKAQKSHTIWTE